MRVDWRRYANDHARAVDASMVLLLLCAAGGQAMLNSSLPGTDDLGWGSALPLAVAASVALLWRREHPGVVVGFTALCAGATAVVGYMITPVNLAPMMVALYELALRASERTTRRYVVAVTVVVTVSAVLGNRHGYPWPLVVLNPVLFPLLPVALGATVKARADNREEEARHRVAEERIRIAHELHDVVAHHLALANAQAGTAAYLAGTHPEQVSKILTDLTGTTSAALRELKATVSVLRQPGDPLEPLPGLGRLPELTAALASAGLAVEFTVAGAERPLPSNVDLTAYRIVQEALTNVTKHAGVGTAQVGLSYSTDRLTITVTNATAGPRNTGEGFGLMGMRERAQSVGGHFQAGPHPEGGFTVTSELPLPR